MKRSVAILCLATTLAGCVKSDPNSTTTYTCSYTNSTLVAPASEVATLQTYLSSRSIVAKKDSSGIFYSIDSVGSGTIAPGVCNIITITYSGNLLLADNSNPVFDANNTGARYTLGDLIVGWQKGLPYIKTGGSITLYIPPTLGYGSTAVGITIPANSYLRFKIQLLGVQ